MEKRINLFKKAEAYSQLDDKLKKANLIGMGVATLLLFFVLTLFGYNLLLSSNITKLSKSKESLTEQLNQDNTQFKVNYISNKTDEIKQFDKNDAHFSQYYDEMKNTFVSNSIPVFSTFKIDNKQNVEMSFDLTSYDDFQKVVGFLESDTLLKNFKSLSIRTASFSQTEGDKNTLQVVGVAKNVNTEI